jgi:outer membrane lipoprotein carrier protein
MWKNAFLLLLLIGCWAGAALAAPVGLSDVIRTLETPFKNDAQVKRGTATSGIYDFQADFFQESHIASIDRVQRGRGEVRFKFLRRTTGEVPLAMFRWEYREPSPQEIVSDGETMWVYLPENRQVIQSDITEVSRQQGDNPVTFLTGLGNLSRDFRIRWASPNVDREGNHILELEPRSVSQLIHRLQIVVDRDAVQEYVENNTTGDLFPILATSVTDPNGNRTTIEFHDLRVNRNISERYFTFNRPAGVEVVRPSELQMGY